jgi:hypothetical protein
LILLEPSVYATFYELINTELIVPAVIDVAFALTQTKLPVKLAVEIKVLWSAVNVEPDTSNQSSSVGVVASVPCIFIDPVIVLVTWYDTVCTPSGFE